MPDLTSAGKITTVPPVLDYRNIGTVVGTTVLATESVYLGGIQVTTQKASGKFVLYDSNGTSTSVIGTLTQGTQTFSNPAYFEGGFRTVNALTIVNDADTGGLVYWGK